MSPEIAVDLIFIVANLAIAFVYFKVTNLWHKNQMAANNFRLVFFTCSIGHLLHAIGIGIGMIYQQHFAMETVVLWHVVTAIMAVRALQVVKTKGEVLMAVKREDEWIRTPNS